MFCRIHKKSFAFTLLELMIAVVIIGVLVAVVLPSMRQYILKSKVSEGLILLRKIYDSEILYASKPVTIRTEDGDIHCQPIPKFVPFIGSFNMGNGYSNQLPWGGGQIDWPPPNRKGDLILGGINIELVGGPTCEYVIWAHHNMGLVGELSIATEAGTVFPAWGTPAKEYRITDSPTYFGFTAQPDSLVASTYNVPVEETLTIWGMADFNGDYPNQARIMSTLTPPEHSTFNRVTSISRSVYWDPSDGEIKGSAGVYQNNVGE